MLIVMLVIYIAHLGWIISLMKLLSCLLPTHFIIISVVIRDQTIYRGLSLFPFLAELIDDDRMTWQFPGKTTMRICMPRSKTCTSHDLMKHLTESFHIEDWTGAACQQENCVQRELRRSLRRIDRSIRQKGTNRKWNWTVIGMMRLGCYRMARRTVFWYQVLLKVDLD
jgi:hypothetical protein